ncbi:MFS transporter [Hutsoniella sourekii]|uniref:MFS transporter n=1 Tax=Hutsoniella sourekii TaxID=87650 RepID=UPI0004B10290|nr:MFS transporter [Hutsoniella sourekii]
MNQTNNKQGGLHFAWIILLATILVLGIFMPIVTSLANLFQISVTQDLGFSRSAFSLNTTITQAVGIFTGPILSKQLGERNFKAMWTGFAVLFGLSLLGYSFAQSAWHFYIASFFLGLSFIATTSIPMTMLINNWFVEKRGLATSIAFAGISAGGFILSPTVTGMIQNLGWRQAYFVYAIIVIVIALVLGLFVIRRTPEEIGLKPYGYQEADIELEDANSDQPAESDDDLDVNLPVKETLTSAFFIMLLLGAVANGLANGGGLQFAPALQEYQSLEVASWTVSAYLLVGVFGKLLMGWIDDKFGLKVTLFSGLGAMALAFVSMLFIGTSWGPWALVITFGGLGIGTGTVLPPIVTSCIYSNDRYPEAYGYVTSATQIGTAIGPLIVPLIFDLTGHYNPAWILMTAITIAAAVFWFLAYQRASALPQQAKD